MGKPIDFTISNFRAGVHTKPADVRGGHNFARDAKNVRHDNESGDLIARYAVASRGATLGDDLVGLSRAVRDENEIISYLLDTGELKLYLDGGTDPSLVTDVNLTGKLSSGSLLKDRVLVTSEGIDQGYILDLSAYDPPSTPTVTTHQHGFDAPDTTSTTAAEGTPGSISTDWYYYKITYYLDDIDSVDHETESQGSAETIEEEVTVGSSKIDLAAIPVSGDSRVTHKKIYRTVGQSAQVATPSAIDALTYYEVGQIQNATAVFSDTLADASITSNSQLNKGNNRMPAAAKQIAVLHDLVFCACGDELRFSDTRNGAPAFWAFPEDNNILADGTIDFVAAYRSVILFGGPQGIWRLSGASLFDFRVEKISDVGPVDRAAKVVEVGDKNFLAFIGINGLYFCDGVDATSVHMPLEQYFDNLQVKAASVVGTPAEDVVFTIDDNTTAHNFVRKRDGNWQRWEGINLIQGETIITTSIVTGQKSYDVLIAEDASDEFREILWDRDSITQDVLAGSSTDIAWSWKTQRLDWSWRGIKSRTKMFQTIEIKVPTATTLTLQVWVDGTSVLNKTLTVSVNPVRPYRVLINRRGEYCELELSGTAAPRIEEVKLNASVL